MNPVSVYIINSTHPMFAHWIGDSLPFADFEQMTRTASRHAKPETEYQLDVQMAINGLDSVFQCSLRLARDGAIGMQDYAAQLRRFCLSPQFTELPVPEQEFNRGINQFLAELTWPLH